MVVFEAADEFPFCSRNEGIYEACGDVARCVVLVLRVVLLFEDLVIEVFVEIHAEPHAVALVCGRESAVRAERQVVRQGMRGVHAAGRIEGFVAEETAHDVHVRAVRRTVTHVKRRPIVFVGRCIRPLPVAAEAVRGVAEAARPGRELFEVRAGAQTGTPCVVVGPGGIGICFELVYRFFGDDVDDRSHGVGTVERRGCAVYHLDALDVVHVDLVEVYVASGPFRYEAFAVDEHQDVPAVEPLDAHVIAHGIGRYDDAGNVVLQGFEHGYRTGFLYLPFPYHGGQYGGLCKSFFRSRAGHHHFVDVEYLFGQYEIDRRIARELYLARGGGVG